MFDINRILFPNRKLGLVQIVHDFQFVALNVFDDYNFLREMNHDKRLMYMKERLERLAERKYAGVVLNVDFENYLKNDESFKLLDEVIDIACELDLRVWLYDEQYYPSGGAGGLTLHNHPELEAQGLVCVCKEYTATNAPIRIASPYGHSELKYAYAIPKKGDVFDYRAKVNVSKYKDVAGGLCWNAPEGEWKIYTFFVRTLYEMAYIATSLRASRRYPNIADKRAIERFVELTYEKYEKYLKTPLGKRVEAVFTDEPSIMFYRANPKDKNQKTRYSSISIYDESDADIPPYPYIPWSNDMESAFLNSYGFDVSEILSEIFDETENTREYRIMFYKLVDRMIEHAYVDTLCDYMQRQEMLLSGHYLLEEEFNRHPFLYGDILRHLGRMDIPGCDRLFSEIDLLKYSSAMRVASSAAHIYGKKNVMIEASNMFDKEQKLSEQDLHAAITLMFINGIDTITSYYGENLYDEEGMKRFAEYVSLLGSLVEGGKFKIDTLLYYPFEQLCAARIPDGPHFVESTMLDTLKVENAIEILMKNQICFDMINKDKLLECKIGNGQMITDYGETVKNILFPEIDFLDVDTAKFVNKMHINGINVVFEGEKRKIEGLDFEPLFTSTYTITSSDLTLNECNSNLVCMHSGFEDHDIYLLMNTERKAIEVNVNFPFDNPKISVVNLETKELRKLSDNNGSIRLGFEPLQSYAIVVE